MRGDRSGPGTPSKPAMRILRGFKSLLRSKREAEAAKESEKTIGGVPESHTGGGARAPLAAEPRGAVKAHADGQARVHGAGLPVTTCGGGGWGQPLPAGRGRLLGQPPTAGGGAAVGGQPDCTESPQQSLGLSCLAVLAGVGSGADLLGCKARFCQFTFLAVWSSWGTH